VILGISISVGFSVAAHNKVTKLSSVVAGSNSLALGCSSIKFSKDVFSVVVVVVVVLGIVVVVCVVVVVVVVVVAVVVVVVFLGVVGIVVVVDVVVVVMVVVVVVVVDFVVVGVVLRSMRTHLKPLVDDLGVGCPPCLLPTLNFGSK